MSTARKLLRLFESAREYAALAKLYKQDMHPIEKKLAIAGQWVMMIYWLAENLYILAKLRILPVGENWLFKSTVWLGLVAYLITMFTQKMTLQMVEQRIGEVKKSSESEESVKHEQLKALLAKKMLIYTIIAKESADNIGLLPLLNLCKPSFFVDLLGSLGSLFNGVVSLYLKYK